MEIWKSIIYKGVDYTNFYEVSNYGRVRSKKFKKIRIIKQTIIKNKSTIVNLTKINNNNRVKVGILVLNAFKVKSGKGEKVCHIDGDITNNKLDNLIYIRRNIVKYGRGINKIKKGFRCMLFINKVNTHLGTYKTLKEAKACIEFVNNIETLNSLTIKNLLNTWRELIGLKKIRKWKKLY